MRVLVTGAGGQLGRDLAGALGAHDAILLDRGALDVTDPNAVEGVLRAAEPDAIVHCAAWTDVDGCERDPERARLVNVAGTQHVVEAAGGAFVVVVSTDYVFDGTLGRAYAEDDAPNPLQTYGRTKHDAEEVARATIAAVAVVRSAWLYGAGGRGFVQAILRAARAGSVEVVADQVGSPTATADLAPAIVALCERKVPGTFHVVNEGEVSRLDLARAALAAAGFDPGRAHGVRTADAPTRAARRPAYAPLEGRAWRAAGFEPLASWEDAVRRSLPAIVEAL